MAAATAGDEETADRKECDARLAVELGRLGHRSARFRRKFEEMWSERWADLRAEVHDARKRFRLRMDNDALCEARVLKHIRQELDRLEVERDRVRAETARLQTGISIMRQRQRLLEKRRSGAAEDELRARVALHEALATAQREMAARADRRNNDHEKRTQCVICMTKPRSVLVLPCRHIAICDDCDRNLNDRKCSVCRTQIASVVNVLFA